MALQYIDSIEVIDLAVAGGGDPDYFRINRWVVWDIVETEDVLKTDWQDDSIRALLWDGLTPGTDYGISAKHKNIDWSASGAVTEFTTLGGPVAPSLTLLLEGVDSASWRSSSYVDAMPAHSMDMIVETRAGVFVAGFSLAIDPDALTSMSWREFTVDSIPIDEPELRAKIRHNAVVDDEVYYGAFSATVDFELVVSEGEEDPVDVPSTIVNGEYTSEFPWPTTFITVQLHVGESGELGALGDPLFAYITLGGVRKQVSPLNGWIAEFAYIPLDGSDGEIEYEIYVRGHSSGFPVRLVRPPPEVWSVPNTLSPPYFVHLESPKRPVPAGGEAVTGTYHLEWTVFKDGVIVGYTRIADAWEEYVPEWILPYKITYELDPGYFRIPTWLTLESSQDEGVTWLPVATQIVENVEQVIGAGGLEDVFVNKWEYDWDSTDLESCGDTGLPTWLRVRTHQYLLSQTTEESPVVLYEPYSQWRQSAPFYIAHEDEVFSRQRDTLELSEFTTYGVGFWGEYGDGARRTITRYSAAGGNNSGMAILDEVGTPRSFEVIIEAKFKSGIYAALGTAGYASQDEGDLFSAILSHARGHFGAWNRDFGPVRAFTGTLFYWDQGIWYGKGTGGRYVGDYGPHGPMTLPGLEKISDADTSFTQWLGKPYIEPWYQLRVRYTLLETFLNGSHSVRIESQLTGPDIGGFTFTDSRTINGKTWPLGGVGFSSFTERGGSDEFRSIGVLSLDPDSEIETGAPCMLEWTLYEADNETIRAQATTDHTWLGESGEAKPYLLDPLQYGEPYGEQEVDFAAGTASITTVNVRMIDPPTIAGEQDSGWMTALKSSVAGRRNRLRRFIDEDNGWVTIADGPGSSPKLLGSFAGYEWSIKDTREKERRLRAFDGNSPIVILPFGLLEERWGVNGSDVALVEEAGFISAEYDNDPEIMERGGFFKTFQKPPGFFVFPPYNAAMGKATEQLVTLDGPIGGAFPSGYYPNVAVIWRLEGAVDWRYAGELRPGWTAESRRRVFAPTPNWPMLSTLTSGGETIVDTIWVTFPAGEEPANGANVEFYVLYVGPASPAFPFYIDGLTAGEFLVNLYEGEYSPRDSVTGEIVPTGIRYDADVLYEMTTPVRLRITEPVKDIRSWTEKNIYAPLGYAPALDSDGLISPVSQEIPTDSSELAGFVEITNDITQAVPGHAPGDNVINVLTFKYQRAYSDPDNSEQIDGLVLRDIEIIYRDEASIERHGEEEVEIETFALVAVGDDEGTAIGEEEGATAADARQVNLFLRRVNGTDLCVVPCMRIHTFDLRVGDFVRVLLSWLPNDDTGFRAVDHLAQILAIKDLNCSWREFTFELVQPWPYPSGYS